MSENPAFNEDRIVITEKDVADEANPEQTTTETPLSNDEQALDQQAREGDDDGKEAPKGAIQPTRKSKVIYDSNNKPHVLTLTNDNDPNTPEKALLDGVTIATVDVKADIPLQTVLVQVQNRFANTEKAVDRLVNKIEETDGAEKALDTKEAEELLEKIKEAEKDNRPEDVQALADELIKQVEKDGGKDLLAANADHLVVSNRTIALAESAANAEVSR